jgi:hypothetical protein
MCTVRVFLNFLFGRFFCFLQLSLKLCCGLTLPQTEPFAEINRFHFYFLQPQNQQEFNQFCTHATNKLLGIVPQTNFKHTRICFITAVYPGIFYLPQQFTKDKICK